MTASFPGAVRAIMSRGALMSDATTQGDFVDALQEEVRAIESTLGINPQGGSATVDARLDLLDSGVQSWTPSWTNLTLGSATQTSGYLRVGKLIFGAVRLIFGAGTAVTGGLSFATPTTAQFSVNGSVRLFDNSAGTYAGSYRLAAGSSSLSLSAYDVSGSLVHLNSVTTGVPWAWTSLDEIELNFWYVSTT